MTESRFRRGDRVEFRFVLSDVQGVVVEDIGVGGRRLYGIKFQFGQEVEEPTYIELPAVRLRKVEDAAVA